MGGASQCQRTINSNCITDIILVKGIRAEKRLGDSLQLPAAILQSEGKSAAFVDIGRCRAANDAGNGCFISAYNQNVFVNSDIKSEIISSCNFIIGECAIDRELLLLGPRAAAARECICGTGFAVIARSADKGCGAIGC